jgi:RNA polymerase sigma-70 factor, ECF subfamily
VSDQTSPNHLASDRRRGGTAFASQECSEWSDSELAAAIGRRNETALAEAYGRHGIAVYQIAFRLCGPKKAENVTHRVFLDLWDNKDFFDPNRCSMHVHLVTASHRLAVQILRRADAAMAVSQTHDRSTKALALSANKRVRDLLIGLSEFEAQAVVLAYFAGLSCGQIADGLDQTENYVKENLRSGMFKLRLNIVNSRPSEG